ncbi:hypothetical protein OIU77_012333 [Salix suchowensis]|uniref:Uncharacterized protein n=1 Tax=Salix suchowensis TaxID=1278906 RepID=A0ABQ9A5H9_9ROSI|nr:hypothetical protein OIU77_012333 [Salix suchowensis]KAJ6322468.1 hypothetical protein OIU77_012333 [Salix suchowensis]
MLSQREGSLTCSLFLDADSYAAFIRGKVGELGGANFQTSPVYRVKPSFTELHPISFKFSVRSKFSDALESSFFSCSFSF